MREIDDERVALLVLNRLFPYNPKEVRELIIQLGSPSSIVQKLLTHPHLLGRRVMERVKEISLKSVVEESKRELEWAEKSGVDILYCERDPRYPKRLLETPDPPILLYKRGEIDLNSRHIISIVGSRRATPYGVDFCNTVVKELGNHFPDVIVVSGFAYGIDIAAHKAAFRERLATVAVLGCGVDRVYPAGHTKYRTNVITNGAIVTEFSQKSGSYKINFIRRNRVIAGLSDALLVVESKAKGGSLITASLAQQYSREVFALPGRVSDPLSEGCNRLISQNRASLFTSVLEMVKEIGWSYQGGAIARKERGLFSDLTEEKEKILLTLSREGEIDVDGIATITELPLQQVLSLLLELEFEGRVYTLPGMRYSISTSKK